MQCDVEDIMKLVDAMIEVLEKHGKAIREISRKDFLMELVKDEGFVIAVKTIAENVATQVVNKYHEEEKEVKE